MDTGFPGVPGNWAKAPRAHPDSLQPGAVTLSPTPRQSICSMQWPLTCPDTASGQQQGHQAPVSSRHCVR